MAKPSITTRATKGSALTWTEGDANLENLRDATVTIKAGAGGTDVVSDLNGTVTLVAGTNVSITGDNTNKTVTINSTSSGLTDVIQDTTPQLGGNLDVNGYAILSANNGHIDITPNGAGNIRLTPATGKITLGATDWPSGMGTNGQVLTTNGTGTLSWTTPAAGSSDVVSDTTPQLGGDLDVNGKSIVSVSNGNISIVPNGSGNIMITPTTGKIILGAVDWPTSNPSNNTFLVGQSTGSSSWTNTIKGYNEGSLYDLGTTGGTVSPDVANGNVQKITLNSALTLNEFSNPIAGQSLTLIIYGGTSYTSITSTMKFASGDKTLTGTAGCIDILSVYYDGTNYFASLGKGFA